MSERDVTRGRTRTTKQRKLILAELQALTCHPTAEQLYQIVRDQMPHISLGTVYRNLEVLSDQGEIQRLEATGGQMHFDGNPVPHSHIRCHTCGAVADVDWPFELPALSEIQHLTDWDVTARTVELTGYCPACRPAGGTAADEKCEEASSAE